MNERNGKVYCIGGGIASLATAVYCIKDAGVRGEDVCIFDEAKRVGGSLDAQDLSEADGYVMRGIRMFEEKAFTSTFDLMSAIPSLTAEGKTLREEFVDFNKKSRSYSKSRLLKSGEAVDARPLGLGMRDRMKLITLLVQGEKPLEGRDIQSYFTPEFFASNFWYEFCTVFAFQPWHSVTEFRRYLIRFIQDFSTIDTLENIEISPYNQYEFMVLPIVDWLKKQGVIFVTNARVENIEFKDVQDGREAKRITYVHDGKQKMIEVVEGDKVIATLGSIVANSACGSMHTVPQVDHANKPAAWALWETIAQGRPEFGVPTVFNGNTEKTGWTSFTITFRDPTFFKDIQKFVHKKVTTYGGVNLIDSNWLMSIVLSYKPYFVNQPKDVDLCWGYGLRPEAMGNVVKKKIGECTGEEILTELVHHLGFEKDLEKILAGAVCIPCSTPYITSLFLPRKVTDRPAIRPTGAKNFAFVGQYCEIPGDVVFTVEYSIRSAQTAVYDLFAVNKKPASIYDGTRHIGVMLGAARTLLR